MPDIKIITEVAGRVCALPVEVGGSVADGEEVAFVEAMKMEIPVPSPAAGTVKSLLVVIDDVVAEGQVIANPDDLLKEPLEERLEVANEGAVVSLARNARDLGKYEP